VQLSFSRSGGAGDDVVDQVEAVGLTDITKPLCRVEQQTEGRRVAPPCPQTAKRQPPGGHFRSRCATVRPTRCFAGMSDTAASQEQLTAEQYRERAKLARQAEQGVKSALLRHDLLDIAAQYDHLAESVERWGSDDSR
jgi:hypothetical protein